MRKKGMRQDGKEPVSQMVSCRGLVESSRKEGLINIGRSFGVQCWCPDLANVSTQLLPPVDFWIMGDSAWERR